MCAFPSAAEGDIIPLQQNTSAVNHLSKTHEMPSSLPLPTVEELTYAYVLDSLKGVGPQKFKQLYDAGIHLSDAIRDPKLIPTPGKRGDAIRKQLSKISADSVETCRVRADKQLKAARTANAAILTYGHPLYPKAVWTSNNPIPILYVRGNAEILKVERAVACVGSRKIREPYVRLHERFAQTACNEHFTIVSGFALGADTVGHTAAVACGGKTICVMPSGLDRPFPPENKDLWQRWLSTDSVVFVSEFSFGTGAASLNLRKRNKLIVAFALGVLVSQSSATGGAMNAYRFAIEQKKPIATLQGDETEDTSGNRQIALAENPKSTVFSVQGAENQEFVGWLHTLLSLI
jgi:DNA protecting protein DprA